MSFSSWIFSFIQIKAIVPVDLLNAVNWSRRTTQLRSFIITMIVCQWCSTLLVSRIFAFYWKWANLGNASEIEFEFEFQTGAYDSCSTVQNGLMFVFGGTSGSDYENQISIVEDCRLRRIGSLPMRLYWGACNSFTTNNDNQISLLCFDYNDRKACHRFKYSSNLMITK